MNATQEKEILQLAAKAAGVSFAPNLKNWWNPLQKGGQAIQLAEKLGMVVDTSAGIETLVTYRAPGGKQITLGAESAKLAIVLAAAEIGKFKQEIGKCEPTEITQRDRDVWRAAITLAHDLCIMRNDEHNESDQTAIHCAHDIADWFNPDDDRLAKIISEEEALKC